MVCHFSSPDGGGYGPYVHFLGTSGMGPQARVERVLAAHWFGLFLEFLGVLFLENTASLRTPDLFHIQLHTDLDIIGDLGGETALTSVTRAD